MTVPCHSHNSNGFNLSQFTVHQIKTYAHFHKGNQTQHCENLCIFQSEFTTLNSSALIGFI